MLMIGSVTMLRTVAEFSAATLPIPVSTIGKFCFWTVVAMTGMGVRAQAPQRGGSARNVVIPRNPRDDRDHHEADKQRGSPPALHGGFIGNDQWRGHGFDWTG